MTKKNATNAYIDAAESFSVSVRDYGLDAIMGAAYMLTDRAYAVLSGDPKIEVKVSLRIKDDNAMGEDLNTLRDVFLKELETQKIRWTIAKNNIQIREYLAEGAIRIANGLSPFQEQTAKETLDDSQRQEIEKLIAEVEAEIKAMEKKGADKDVKNIAASWEESHQERPS